MDRLYEKVHAKWTSSIVYDEVMKILDVDRKKSNDYLINAIGK